jgi:hypothetical protein
MITFLMFYTNIVLILAIAFGLGGLVGGPNNKPKLFLGYQSFIGFCLLVILLFILIVPLRLGFDWSLVIIACLSFAGFVRSIIFLSANRGLSTNGWTVEPLAHPIILLPIMLGLIGATSAPVSFLPYGDDTYANWLTHSKQIWLINDFWFEGMNSSGLGYPPGWHFLLAFTSSMWGEYSDLRALASPAAFHIVLLGLVFDAIIIQWRELDKTDTRMGLWVGLIFIFFALAAEASWKLLPTLILSEMPLFYSSIGLFALALFYWAPGSKTMEMTTAVAIVICAHYLFKSQGLALVPVGVGLVFVGVFVNRHGGENRIIHSLAAAILALVPVMAVMIIWNALGPQSPKCNANAAGMISGGVSGLVDSGYAATLAKDLLTETTDYLGSYKVPVTILSIAGLIVAFWFRRYRWVSLSVFAYCGVYLVAVYTAYLGCPDGFNQYLSSLKRYLQLPVRSVHFVGILTLFLLAMHFYVKRWSHAYARQFKLVVLVCLVAFSGFQFYALKRSFQQLKDPAISTEMRNFIRTIPLDTEEILQIAAEHGIEKPRVLLAYVFWEFMPHLVARHHGFPSSRNSIEGLPADILKKEPDALSRWKLTGLRYPTADSLRPVGGVIDLSLESQDIIWMREYNDSLARQLRSLVSDPSCKDDPSKYYLVRTGNGTHPFTCRSRTTAAQ